MTGMGAMHSSNGLGQTSVSFLISQGRVERKGRISSMEVRGELMNAVRLGGLGQAKVKTCAVQHGSH